MSTSKVKCKSMNVYSFGIIGYEILTRIVICSDSKLAVSLIQSLIIDNGQIANEDLIDQVEKELTNKRND